MNKEKVVLTEDEIKLCKQAVNRTYQTIAEDGHFPDTAKVEEILEVVLDADYVKMYGGISKELYDKFDDWVQQELATGNWNANLRRIAKVIWYR